jgi:hypothetical protein
MEAARKPFYETLTKQMVEQARVGFHQRKVSNTILINFHLSAVIAMPIGGGGHAM